MSSGFIKCYQKDLYRWNYISYVIHLHYYDIRCHSKYIFSVIMNFEIKLFGYWFIILSQHWRETAKPAQSLAFLSILFVYFKVLKMYKVSGLWLLGVYCWPPIQRCITRAPRMVQSNFLYIINKELTFLQNHILELTSHLGTCSFLMPLAVRFLPYALGVKVT